jgi:hypothetical protein
MSEKKRKILTGKWGPLYFHSQMEIWTFLMGGGTVVSVPNPQLTFRVQMGQVTFKTKGSIWNEDSPCCFGCATDYLKIIPVPWHKTLTHQIVTCWVSDVDKVPSERHHEAIELICSSEPDSDGNEW